MNCCSTHNTSERAARNIDTDRTKTVFENLKFRRPFIIMDSVSGYQAESSGGKFMRKVKENPFVPLGVVGMVSAVGYGIYNYKNRGNMKTSVYLMHLRVKAQSMVVGAIALGIGYSLIQDYLKKGSEKKQ